MPTPAPSRRRTAPGLALARAAARQTKLEARARQIGASLDVTRKKSGKFHAIKSTYNGEKYDSLGEAERAATLDLLLAAGVIKHWSRPKVMILLDAPKARDRVTYKPDFLVVPAVGEEWYEDYKGSTVGKDGKRRTPTETQAFRIRVKLWKAIQRSELRVIYSDGVIKVVAPARLDT